MANASRSSSSVEKYSANRRTFSSFAGVAGALQASYLGATTSDFFQFSTSILVLIAILGAVVLARKEMD